MKKVKSIVMKSAPVVMAPAPEVLDVEKCNVEGGVSFYIRQEKEMHFEDSKVHETDKAALKAGAAWMAKYTKQDEAGRRKMLGWKKLDAAEVADVQNKATLAALDAATADEKKLDAMTKDNAKKTKAEKAADKAAAKQAKADAKAAKKPSKSKIKKALAAPLVPVPEATATNLGERAMLVDLSIGAWLGQKFDYKTTGEVLTDSSAESDGGVWRTHLVPRKMMKKIRKIISTSRAAHYELTLPWNDGGIRILPAALFLAYTEEMRKHESEFMAIVTNFIEVEYDGILAEAATRLGKLYRPEQYPTPAQLRKKFSFHTHVQPIPSAGDFRVALGSDTTEAVKADIEKQTKEAIDRATGSLWERLHQCVEKIAERLSDADATFRDSLIGNVQELAGMLPVLNIMGDKNLADMAAKVMEKLGNLSPDSLRENAAQRSDAAKAANSILKSMEGMFGKQE